jgi:hypothetical protein
MSSFGVPKHERSKSDGADKENGKGDEAQESSASAKMRSSADMIMLHKHPFVGCFY